jgi:hypothetical protein
MPKASELVNFYWHCAVVTQLIQQFPPNPATKSDMRWAIRKATEALTGTNGVPYASLAAQEARALNGGRWEGCGLVREHAIPVGHIYREIVGALSKERSASDLAAGKQRLDAAMMEIPAKRGAFLEFPDNACIAIVVDVIRSATTMAWLTKQEDQLLNKRVDNKSESVNKRMPPGWDGVDPLDRYKYCGILVYPITN